MEQRDIPDSEQPDTETLRQQLIRMLTEREQDFVELRTALALAPRVLESELRQTVEPLSFMTEVVIVAGHRKTNC
jgi:hypothetical protein